MKKFNVAVIGCGRIAHKHFESLKKMDNVELTGLAEIKADRLNRHSNELKVKGYIDFHEMLDEQSIDVVEVLTPSGSHADIAIEVMKRGKHVIVEKPMALRVEDAYRMIETADKYNVKLFVVKQNRFNSAVQKARTAFKENRFGKLVLGTVRVRWSRNQAYYDQDSWRGTWAQDGGVFTNQASHHIDLLQWFMGPVESAMAFTSKALVNIEAEDTGVAVLRFVSGALGVIEATTATRPKDLEGSLSILGEKGTVEIGGFAVNQIKVWNFTEQLPEDSQIRDDIEAPPPNVYGFGHGPYLQHVFNSLANGKPALVEGLEGIKSVEIINAIYESAATGKQVKIHNMYRNSMLGR